MKHFIYCVFAILYTDAVFIKEFNYSLSGSITGQNHLSYITVNSDEVNDVHGWCSEAIMYNNQWCLIENIYIYWTNRAIIIINFERSFKILNIISLCKGIIFG